MLVLTRKIGEAIVIGDEVFVSIASIDGSRVRLAIDAPRSIEVVRSELLGETATSKQDSADRLPESRQATSA